MIDDSDFRNIKISDGLGMSRSMSANERPRAYWNVERRREFPTNPHRHPLRLSTNKVPHGPYV